MKSTVVSSEKVNAPVPIECTTSQYTQTTSTLTSTTLQGHCSVCTMPCFLHDIFWLNLDNCLETRQPKK